MSVALPRPLSIFTERRTWGELLYAVLGLPIGVALFAFTVTTVAFSAGLLVTFVGLPLLAVTGLISRTLGQMSRRLANRLAGGDVAPPQPFHANPGLLGWIGSCLTDGTAWRARLYSVLKLPLGIATFMTATFFVGYGVGGVTYAIWRPFLPCNKSLDDVCHHGVGLTSGYYLDTPFRVVLTAVAGALILLAAPWAIRAVVSVDRALVRPLLGPTANHRRVAELERSRSVAVDDAATTLRRIERDLHDGTQARLVALAMNVGLAKEKLAEGSDQREAQRLLDTAHQTAKQAIAEVRDLAKGIHPPALDAGLDAALATLAANSAVPVTVTTRLETRPVQAIETIAYFCAAELLTNVAKHSGASHAELTAGTEPGGLVLLVRDNGSGGAHVGDGTGLPGLIERVNTVDGTLTMDSPTGGPTTVTIHLPLALPG
jgi:signal transduction histidine kinase